MVLLSSIVDTLCTIIEVVCVYGYSITNFGNFEAMAIQGEHRYSVPTAWVLTSLRNFRLRDSHLSRMHCYSDSYSPRVSYLASIQAVEKHHSRWLLGTLHRWNLRY
jgi:hypothetical protein